MNHGPSSPGEKSRLPRTRSGPGSDALRVVIIAEDLRTPLDEGAKKVVFSLIRSFMETGTPVFVFTQYKNPLLEKTFPLPDNKLLVGCQFLRELKAQAPDVILYAPSSSGTLGAFARAAAIKTQTFGTPLVLLNLQYRELPSFARHLNLHRYADVVLAQSQASVNVFRSFGCKTYLLPGSVDQDVFRPVDTQEKHLLRVRYGFDDSEQIVLHIGHCNRGRNVMMLARLAKMGLKVILIASTSTPIDSDLLVELRQAGVMVINDFIASIQHYYQLADCYVFPVFHATSAIDAPLSILEAMACNLPVVTTRFGALPDMFEAGGGLYYGSTEDEIVSWVRHAVTEQHSKTREKVSPYTWEHTALTILDVFMEVGI